MMTTAQLIAIAKDCQEYRFGSHELEPLHFKYRSNGRFSETFWYLVFHPGLSGADSFHTLNHAQHGQQLPMMYDLPQVWRTMVA